MWIILSWVCIVRSNLKKWLQHSLKFRLFTSRACTLCGDTWSTLQFYRHMVGRDHCRSDSCPKSLPELCVTGHHACFVWHLRGEDWLSNLVLDGSTNALGLELFCARNGSTVFEFCDDWNMESPRGIRKWNDAKCLFVAFAYTFKNVCGDRILPISRVFCYNNIGQSANKCPENGKTLNAFKKKIIELKHTNWKTFIETHQKWKWKTLFVESPRNSCKRRWNILHHFNQIKIYDKGRPDQHIFQETLDSLDHT